MYVITISQRHRQTDDMQSQDRALHYSASSGRNFQTLQHPSIQITPSANLIENRRTHKGWGCSFPQKNLTKTILAANILR